MSYGIHVKAEVKPLAGFNLFSFVLKVWSLFFFILA